MVTCCPKKALTKGALHLFCHKTFVKMFYLKLNTENYTRTKNFANWNRLKTGIGADDIVTG